MRFNLFLCCLLAALPLFAQTDNKLGGRWEISANFAPDLRKRVELSGLRFEINPSNIPVSQQPRGDTLLINGQQRVFDRTNAGGIKTRPTEADFWFGATLRAHRRFKRGFDISVGLYFSRAAYTNQLQDELFRKNDSPSRSAYIYSTEKARYQHTGISLAGTYHLFEQKRLHPYLGLGLNALLNTSERELLGRVYVGESDPEQFSVTSTDPVENILLDIDFTAIAGVLYQLNDHWSVGIEYSTIDALGPGGFGAQVRRSF